MGFTRLTRKNHGLRGRIYKYNMAAMTLRQPVCSNIHVSQGKLCLQHCYCNREPGAFSMLKSNQIKNLNYTFEEAETVPLTVRCKNLAKLLL